MQTKGARSPRQECAPLAGKKRVAAHMSGQGRICITKNSCLAVVFCCKKEELGLRGGVVGALIFTKSPLSHHWKMKGLDCIGGSQAWLHEKCHKHPVKDITDWAPV